MSGVRAVCDEGRGHVLAVTHMVPCAPVAVSAPVLVHGRAPVLAALREAAGQHVMVVGPGPDAPGGHLLGSYTFAPGQAGHRSFYKTSCESLLYRCCIYSYLT